MTQRASWPMAAVRALRGLTVRLWAKSPRLFPFLVTLATLAATIHVFKILNDPIMVKPPGGDEGSFVWGGWCVTKGLVPYREFLEFKPPLVFLTHALALKLYGFPEVQFRRFFSNGALVSIVALHLSLLSRRVDKWLALALAIALVGVWINPAYHDQGLGDSESIGLCFYFLGLAFLLVRLPLKLRPYARAIAGVFITCCIFSKEPFLPCAFLTWIAGFFFEDDRTAKRQRVVPYVLQTGAGVAATVIALTVYMVPTGAMASYIAMVRRYSVVYRDPAQSFCVLGGRFEPTTPLNDLWRAWERMRVEFFNVQTLGILLPLAPAYIAYTARRSLLLFSCTALACAFGLYGVSLSNCQWAHYYNIPISGLFLCAAVGLDSMTGYLLATDRSTRLFIRLVALSVVFAAIWPRFEGESVSYGKRKFPSADSAPAVGGALEAVREHTSPSDRVFTTGNPIFYVQANRVSAARESIFLDPILPFYVGDTDAEKLRPVYDELVKNRPKIVVLDPEFGPQKERHRQALFEPFLREMHYKQLSSFIYLRPD